MSSTRIPFFDPHFHIWDVSAVHGADILGHPSTVHPTYTLEDYERQVEAHAPWLELVGGCFVEALPRGDDTVAELEWLRGQFASYLIQCQARAAEPKNYCTVARVNLLTGHAKEVLRAITGIDGLATVPAEVNGGHVKAVRQILNHNPSWPYIDHDLLTDSDFLDSFAMLQAAGIKVFELHVNPHQLLAAADALVQRYPDTTFVLNHMGCLRGKVDSFDAWYEGMAKLASFPNVFVKLSGFEYPDAEGWLSNPLIPKMFHALLKLFGYRRSMVASNFPVTSTLGAPPEKLFPFLEQLVAKELPREAADDIMWRTALRVYCNRDELPRLSAHVGS